MRIMKIGCPKEIKDNENRVGLTPNAVQSYTAAGHTVYVETGAGAGSAFGDSDYAKAGATLLATAEEVWASADMIVKVKEPLAQEYPLMREHQLIYTYFHFAADEELTRACLARKIVALAYETVWDGKSLPLLKPMSEVAGRMAPIMGAYYLAKPQGGRGILPTGVNGVSPSDVLVVGGGVVGTNAARIAAGMGANVTILDVSLERLEHLGNIMPANVDPVFSDSVNLEAGLRKADMVIGAVLIPGAVTPKLVKREHLAIMKPGSVIVDVAIDQGGCIESARATSHSDPVYVENGIIHYCVGNMPGAYARTSTQALNNATIRYGLALAAKGVEAACRDDAGLRMGLNVYRGNITYRAVAEAFGLQDSYVPAEKAIGA